MRISIENFCTLLNAKIIVPISNKEIEFNRVSIDSRTVLNDASTLFFALIGANHDGHDYIKALIQKGVKYFVVSQSEKIKDLNEQATFFVVENTLNALQQLASCYRHSFAIPIIGITGSRGKTVVKEWLNFLLKEEYQIIKSPKSYNSQVGVPLSVLGISNQHSIGIFEVGISTINEMDKLQSIVSPTIGILTAITNEHEEGFESEEQKIKEKLKLFTNTPVVIGEYNSKVQKYLSQSSNFYSWSFSTAEAMVFGTIKENRIEVLYNKVEKFEVELPFTDFFSIKNSMTCIATMLYLSYDIVTIQERMKKLFPIELRLEVKAGINDCTIIDDAYSSDFQSLVIALEFLAKHKSNTKKTVILSDVFSGGIIKEELYKEVASLLLSHKIDKVICIGEEITKFLAKYSSVWHFLSTDEFLQKAILEDFNDETILIKGSRGFRFDKIVSALEEKTHETVLEVNLTAIRHNLNFYRSKLLSTTKIMVMVKAYGYGHGSVEIAKLLEHEQVDYLGVAFADEGITLRRAGVKTNIIVMNPEISAFSAMIAYDLEPEIYSIRELKFFLKVAREKNCYQYPIHIKLETGMHRHGFLTNELDELISLLKHTNTVVVQSIFSHLSSSDIDQYKDFTLEQINLFTKNSNYIKEQLHCQPICHILNTSGIYHFSSYQKDMVRLGIGLYGIGNSKDETRYLKNVATLKTRIMQIKTIEPNETVGYGRKFKAIKSTRIATVPIGYADGIPRVWGAKNGYVLINNKKAPITGSICMDMLMVDVSDIACQEGDEVIVFGEELSVQIIADSIDTISYEIFTGISQRVKRIFFEE